MPVQLLHSYPHTGFGLLKKNLWTNYSESSWMPNCLITCSKFILNGKYLCHSTYNLTFQWFPCYAQFRVYLISSVHASFVQRWNIAWGPQACLRKKFSRLWNVLWNFPEEELSHGRGCRISTLMMVPINFSKTLCLSKNWPRYLQNS